MKKILLLAGILAALSMHPQAQDLNIEPSPQAKGYLENLNAMVDHATGTFRYTVPLCEIKSGSLTLPLTLNYVAKGVKAEDYPGIVGYNWNLNVGGVVTRTVRGGFADEDNKRGYIFHHKYEDLRQERGGYMVKNDVASDDFTSYPVNLLQDSINNRLVDGESDIFTASFNGKSINFILRLENNKIVACPLEKTNVKIENQSVSWSIEKWVITDDDGTKYTFEQKEWFCDMNTETVVGTYGMQGTNYILAWYISRVEPINGEPVEFKYMGEATSGGSTENVKVTKIYGYNKIKYNYGRPLLYTPFNFSKYKAEFVNNIEQARSRIALSNLELRVYSPARTLEELWTMQEFNPMMIGRNFKVMGFLGNLVNVTLASGELVGALDDLINICHNSGTTNGAIAAGFLNGARSLVIQCLTERENLQSRELNNAYKTDIKTPLLTRIQYLDKTVELVYDNLYVLSEINVRDIYNLTTSKIRLVLDKGLLTEINCLGADGVKNKHLKFDYYNTWHNNPVKDLWGYYTQSATSYFSMAYLDDTQHRSLSKITVDNSSTLTIDYELNRIDDIRFAGADYEFGGIRVKAIAARDLETGKTDGISYSYPLNGIYVYGPFKNSEQVDYIGFSDNILHSRAINNSKSILRPGNNGLYYPVVREEYEGKGSTSYWFDAPVFDNDLEVAPFPYWRYGNLLGKAVYDKDNRLCRVHRFEYVSVNGECRQLQQVRPNEYYMSSIKMMQSYRNQPNVYYYVNGSARVAINPYDDIFLPNIYPRCNVEIPGQLYQLSFDPCVRLWRKKEFIFENRQPAAPAIGDVDEVSDRQIVTEYGYDLLSNSTVPTSVSTVNSDGTKYIEITERVANSISTDPFITEMKSKNMFANTLKSQVKIEDADGNQKISKETIYKYRSEESGGKQYLLKHETCEYIGDGNDPSNPGLLSFNPDKYRKETTDYRIEGNTCFPVYTKSDLESKEVRYDLVTQQPILVATDVEANTTEAVDYRRFRETIEAPLADHWFNMLESCHEKYIQLLRMDFQSAFYSYLRSRNLREIMAIIKDYISDNRAEFSRFKAGVAKSLTATEINNFYMFYEQELKQAGSPLLTLYDENTLWETVFALRMLYDICEKNEQTKYESYVIPSRRILSTPSLFALENIDSGKKYRLYAVIKNGGGTLTYNIISSSGSVAKNISLSGGAAGKLFIADIDLSAYPNVSGITLNAGGLVDYVALVPAGAGFEAASYNPDGTLFCKFNQNGQMERYEYDSAGRPVKMYDRDGKLLKEFKYNVLLNN